MQQQARRLVVIAGEESGDAHAASFIRQLKINHPTLEISGIGGRHMQAAGAHLLHDLARIGVTGISEVIRHLRTIKRALNDIKQHLDKTRPDLLVLVDYPGFNLRLAQYAKRVLGLRIVYYISPQIWAWKANRIKTIRECVDHMAVILPFEKAIYERAGVPVSFVGHPLVEKIKVPHDLQTIRNQLNLPEHGTLVAFLPGSRRNEIERLMPTLRQTMQRLHKEFPTIHFVIPVAGTLHPDQIRHYLKDSLLPVTLVSGHAIEVVACSDCVVVASGTASLECALLEKPMCIIYKTSLLTYLAATQLIQVNYIGLCNLLQNSMIVPELLQYDCNPQALAQVLSELIACKNTKQTMIKRLQTMKHSLSAQEADISITQLIEQQLITTPS